MDDGVLVSQRAGIAEDGIRVGLVGIINVARIDASYQQAIEPIVERRVVHFALFHIVISYLERRESIAVGQILNVSIMRGLIRRLKDGGRQIVNSSKDQKDDSDGDNRPMLDCNLAQFFLHKAFRFYDC